MEKSNALKELIENHFELCETLHKNLKLIPEELIEKIEDLIYKHFEP